MSRPSLPPRPLFVLLALLALGAGLSRCGRAAEPPAAARATPAAPGQALAAAQKPAPAPGQLSNAPALHTGKPLALAQGPAEPPMELTGSDGAGLELRRLHARAVLHGPLALTELHLTFHNPEPRRREGQFALTLPPGAAISRFAMKINGAWMEGEVVERQQARRVYEDFLHRRQDPAILEQDAGNVFRARVFPIEPRADKEIVVSFSQELADARTAYVLPLRGLPRLQEASIRAFVHTGGNGKAAVSLGAKVGQVQVVQVDERDWQPPADFEVYPEAVGTLPPALRHGNLALARIAVDDKAAAAGFERVIVLFDTSASQAPGFAAKVERLGELVRLAGEHGAQEVAVLAFDQSKAEIYRGPAQGFGPAQVAALEKRAALGASDLGLGLDAAAMSLRGHPGKGKVRVLLVADGMATAGAREIDELRQKIAILADLGVERLDAVALSAARDETLLGALVAGGLAQAGVLVTAGETADFSRLVRRTYGPVEVHVPGAAWVWPSRLEGLQPGQATLVYADLPADKALQIQLRGGVQASFAPQTVEAPRPLLERAWIGARMQLLQQRSTEGDPDLRAALQQQVVQLSIRHRVLSPYTALLVLETEADYARYHLDRKALADILVVSAEGAVVEAPRGQGGFAQIAAQAADKTPLRGPGAPQLLREQAVDGKPAGGKDEPGKTETATNGAREVFKMEQVAEEAPAAKASPAEPPPASAAPAPAPPRPAPADMAEAEHKRDEAAASERAGDAAKAAETRAIERALRDQRPATGSRLFVEPSPAPDGAALRGTGSGGGGTATGRLHGLGGGNVGGGGEGVGHGSGNGRGMAMRARNVDAIQPRLRAFAEQEDDDDEASEDQASLKSIEQNLRDNPALEGRFADLQRLLAGRKVDAALQAAWSWRREQPADVLAAVALGRALQAAGQTEQAARAYGTLVDLYPSRADLRRFAGNLLEELGEPGLALAVDTYRAAVAQRPDHPSGHLMLGLALARRGLYLAALDALAQGLQAEHRSGNFPEIERILREAMGLVAAAWRIQPADRLPEHQARFDELLRRHGVEAAKGPGLRFHLTWETDANDVDFHIFDAARNHASYQQKRLRSGGELYADVTTGYGPECFAIDGAEARRAPGAQANTSYRLFAHYYSKGPMGYGMGRVQVVRYDGVGGLQVETRSFVIMRDSAWVDLGEVGRKAPR